MRQIIFALSLASALFAQSHQADVDRIFSAFNTHTPGCAVGVAHQGTTVLRSGYGMADLERSVPITAETIFESGSVAKQFTAMTLLLLEKQGKISLDDPLRKYLPELPDYGAPLMGGKHGGDMADNAGMPEIDQDACEAMLEWHAIRRKAITATMQRVLQRPGTHQRTPLR